MLFDRVLCAPASSRDGELRSAPSGWGDWNVMLGADRHSAQLKLLLKSLHLLKVGGRLVYCVPTLNPLETAAVVCGALRKSVFLFCFCVGSVPVSAASFRAHPLLFHPSPFARVHATSLHAPPP